MKRIPLLFLLLPLIFVASCAGNNSKPLETSKVTRGNIVAGIPSTGVVMPRNRLEIKPPVAGRIESVLVSEGETVKKGQIIAWMSSSDRAALLDAARSKGAEEVKYWEDVYNPTPIIAPLSGFIILRSVEPGQSVATADPVLVMADKLIVKAQVDETDIGKIIVGQKVNIELDAFQGQSIAGRVEHIAYESELINNVNIYKVDILPVSVPSFFRAGMSANVNFTLSEKKGVLLLPLNAFKKVSSRSYVFMLDKKTGKVASLQITTGLENTNHVEVASGLKEGDEVLIPTAKMIELIVNDHRPRSMNPFQKKDN